MEAFNPIADDYLAEHADEPNRGPFRHFIPLPFTAPLYSPVFFNDDLILEILSGILGKDLLLDQFASDTPYKGSVHQDVHSDLGTLFSEEPDLVHPPALLAINWPFVDVTPERGPFEVATGTHRMPKDEAIAAIEKGDIPLQPLHMDVGDVLIRDPRCLHRGSPNRSDTPRVVAVVSYMRPWYFRDRSDAHPLPRSVWKGLSERERHLLRRLSIDETQ